ncbi:solute carrier organic anion transporter [Candidatus Pacearchaeota archaeon]|nr:solute carrier organic anion transporter [Candidatus Pacearchaeota archaeon]
MREKKKESEKQKYLKDLKMGLITGAKSHKFLLKKYESSKDRSSDIRRLDQEIYEAEKNRDPKAIGYVQAFAAKELKEAQKIADRIEMSENSYNNENLSISAMEHAYGAIQLYKAIGQDNRNSVINRATKVFGKVADFDAGLAHKFMDKNVNRKRKPLEHYFGIISLFGFVLGGFFLSPNLTGNAIANLTTKTTSIIGAGLFIAGIVGTYFWIKKK